MSPKVHLDDEVYAYLQRRARPFDDTPNSVLRRELGLDEKKEAASLEARNEAPSTTSQTESVLEMRRSAVASVEAALSSRLGQPVHLVQAPAAGRSRRGPREQRFTTPAGQVIYLRTRSFDEEKLPFFTMQPATLDDADWYVFVCGGRGAIVAPGEELRSLAPGLHKDGGGDYKPTFILDRSRCEIYAHGEPLEVGRWRDGYSAIAEREVRP
jgi:hypothetical protein